MRDLALILGGVGLGVALTGIWFILFKIRPAFPDLPNWDDDGTIDDQKRVLMEVNQFFIGVWMMNRLAPWGNAREKFITSSAQEDLLHGLATRMSNDQMEENLDGIAIKLIQRCKSLPKQH